MALPCANEREVQNNEVNTEIATKSFCLIKGSKQEYELILGERPAAMASGIVAELIDVQRCKNIVFC